MQLMANHQESNPIDELFQKSFRDMPTTPAANGWDMPSDRVWQGIQTGMTAQPSTSWSLGSKIAAAVGALALVGAIAYFAWPKPEQNPAAPAVPAMQAPSVPAAQQPAPATTGETASEATKADRPSTTTAKPATKPANPTPSTAADPTEPRNSVEGEKSSKPKPPNSVAKSKNGQ
jgi:cytoskeletal protein RodZ